MSKQELNEARPQMKRKKYEEELQQQGRALEDADEADREPARQSG